MADGGMPKTVAILNMVSAYGAARRTSLNKIHMAVVKKSATTFHHCCVLASI